MKRWHRPWTALAVAGVASLLILRAFWPAVPGRLPACTVNTMTGLHCPGCGGTRCVTRLFNGDFAGAWAGNPLILLLLGAGGLWLLAAVIQEWRRRPMPVFPAWAAWVLVALVLGFGVLRNLPWWPFSLLAPA